MESDVRYFWTYQGIKMIWGDWDFNADNLTLCIGEDYEIDLEAINSNAAIVDIIFQVSGKTWANEQVVSNLLKAFDAIFNPQENCCSFGRDKEFSGSDLARKFIKANSTVPTFLA